MNKTLYDETSSLYVCMLLPNIALIINETGYNLFKNYRWNISGAIDRIGTYVKWIVTYSFKPFIRLSG